MRRRDDRSLRWIAQSAALAWTLIWAAGCGPTTTTCDVTTCPSGCCADDGTCHGGTEVAACGSSGATCRSCDEGHACRDGRCAFVSDGGRVGDDAGVDAGVVDAGVVDAGVVDAGVVDAGVVDAGVVDAGVIDAGVVDAGVVDAGIVDGGLDAGVDAGPEFTQLVDVFILTDLSTCFAGNPCAASNCITVYGPDGGTHFADDSAFAVLGPNDPRLTGKAQRECLQLTLAPAEVTRIRDELGLYQSNVREWTDGGMRLELSIHELGPTEAELSRWGTGFWLASWNAADFARPSLSAKTDFVVLTHGIKDHARGTYFDIGGCGGTFGADYGLSGAGYSWVPQSQGAFWFECATRETYVHEWLHQVEWALRWIESFPDRYSGVYPLCGQGDADTFSWFPSTHDWATDPDYPWCGSNTYAGDISQHVLRAHWPPSRRLRGNHCRDSVQNFGETGIDVGGRCP